LGLIGASLALAVQLEAQSVDRNKERWKVATDVSSALAGKPDVNVGSVSRKGTATSLIGKLGQLQKTKQEIREQDLEPVLNGILSAFRLKPGDLRFSDSQVDKLGSTHARYTQYKNGLEVVGTRLSLHVDKNGVVYAAFGNARDGENLPKVAAIDAAKATEQAMAVNSAAKDLKTDGARLVYIVTSQYQDMYLAWEIHVSGKGVELPIDELVFVDAATGKVVDRHTRVFPDMWREVWKVTYGNPPTVYYRINNGTINPAWTSTIPYLPGVDSSNWNNLKDAYDYFHDGHGRLSYDGSDGHIISYLNGNDDPYGAKWVAFDNSLYFGVGDFLSQDYPVGAICGPLASDPDVVTHEFTHGVTQYTSNLTYAFESGALNEAFSDIMSAAQQWWTYRRPQEPDNSTWYLGETSTTPNTPGDAASRYMNDPALDGVSRDYYPGLITDYYYDCGGVHFNSGIVNLAFYLAAQGGSHPRRAGGPNVTGISIDKARIVFYDAFTQYLGPGAQMIEARAATVQAAKDRYGSQSLEAQSVNLAWDAVGVPAIVDNNCSINIATRANAGTGAEILISGIKLSGGGTAKPIIFRGMGPTLASQGVSGVMADPVLTLYSGQTQLAQNDDWSSSPDKTAIQQAASAVGLYPFPDPSLDSAILYTLSSGFYTTHVYGDQGGTGQALVEAYDTDPSNPNHLSGISSRCRITSDPMIAGFAITGQSHKRLLIRAVGPGLAGQVPGYLTNPKLSIHIPGSATTYDNDNWNSSNPAINAATTLLGLTPLQSGSADSVLLIALPPGAYTVVVEGVNGATGVCLVEVYEVIGDLD
jgi:Zn-dependent metalloprotease